MNKILPSLILGSLLLAGCASSQKADASAGDHNAAAGGTETITFATEGTYAPYSYHDEDGNLTGYDVKLAQAVADKLGADAEFVETQWDGIVAGLDAKKYDVIANQVSYSPEREEKYLFSTPYTYAYGTLIVPGDSDIAEFQDLKGKKSAQTATSNWSALAESYGAEIVGTSGFPESIQLVEQGRADATINDNVTWLDYKKQKPETTAKAVAQSDEATKAGFLLRKDEKELQERIDKALQELKDDGTIKKISEEYFGEDISEPAQ